MDQKSVLNRRIEVDRASVWAETSLAPPAGLEEGRVSSSR